MTIENCKKLLEAGILQAYAEGKVIETNRGDLGWAQTYQPDFNHPPENYRIKPKLKEYWLVVDAQHSRVYYHPAPGRIHVIEVPDSNT